MRAQLGLTLTLLLMGSPQSLAQQAPPKATVLVKAPVTGQPDKEFHLISIEWPPGSQTPVHTHLGDEYGSVVEGVYAIREGDGEWKILKAGDSWHMAAGVVHQGKNAGEATKTLNAFVVDKGKPITNPFKQTQ